MLFAAITDTFSKCFLYEVIMIKKGEYIHHICDINIIVSLKFMYILKWFGNKVFPFSENVAFK